MKMNEIMKYQYIYIWYINILLSIVGFSMLMDCDVARIGTRLPQVRYQLPGGRCNKKLVQQNFLLDLPISGHLWRAAQLITLSCFIDINI